MPLIGETNVILVALIDRIRMLDNDMIRLQQKVSVVLKILILDFELSSGKDKEVKVDEKKESPAPAAAAPSK